MMFADAFFAMTLALAVAAVFVGVGYWLARCRNKR